MNAVLQKFRTNRYRGVVLALIFSSAVSFLFFTVRVAGAGSTRYWFLIWNLLLAWLPLFFAWLAVRRLGRTKLSNPLNILLLVLWLGFLPNSFYLVSDLIHLHQTGDINILYDAVMFASFIFNGYIAGYLSLYMIHRELLDRLSRHKAHLIIAGVLLLCSFAIYLGRVLRWNTWDVLINPAGLLFDMSEQVVKPLSNPQLFMTTATFFLLLGSIYAVVWHLVQALRYPRP